MHELVGDITLCILFAWVLGLLAHFFRQPLILAYLIAGFLIGPFGMGWVKSQESIHHLRAWPDLHADVLSDVEDLYAAGADHVTVTRPSDAHQLFTVIRPPTPDCWMTSVRRWTYN